MEGEDKEFEIAKNFHESTLSGKSLLFTNNIGLILLRDVKNDWSCVEQVISAVRDCRSCIPKDHIIKFCGIQLAVESSEDLSKETVDALEAFGFMYQHGVPPGTEHDGTWQTIFFQQDADFWSQDFDDFLKTYPDYLRKKFNEIQSRFEEPVTFAHGLELDG